MRVHQWVPDYISRVEAYLGNAFDIFKQAGGMFQAGNGAGWQVDLCRIAGDHHAAAFAEASKEHLHLQRRCVLGLVENDEAGRTRCGHA